MTALANRWLLRAVKGIALAALAAITNASQSDGLKLTELVCAVEVIHGSPQNPAKEQATIYVEVYEIKSLRWIHSIHNMPAPWLVDFDFENAAFHSMFPADQHIQSNDYSNANAWGIREHYSKGSDTKDSDIEIDRFTGAFTYTAHWNRDGLESIEQATGSCQ